MPQEWKPLMLLAQVSVFYREQNHWPTVQELTQFTRLPADQVKALLEALIKRRFVKIEGETVYPWEAGPSPVVTYRLSPEEIAARYGPPKRYRSREEARRQVGGELVGCRPEGQETKQDEEATTMPTGVRVEWPAPKELLAMADEAAAEGLKPAEVLAERFGVHPGTVRKKLREARDLITMAELREDLLSDQEASAETTEAGKLPAAGELMQMAEEEANRLVEADVAHEDARSEAAGTPTLPEEETASSGPQDAPAVDDLDTFHALILVSPTEVRTELVHVTMAPTAHADEWPEIVRVDGRQQVRVWTCVGVQRVGDHPVAVMIPKGYAVVRVRDVHERRTA